MLSNYQIVSFIMKGNQSKVYLGRCTDDQSVVAIKCYPCKENQKNPTNEIQLLDQCQNDYIIPIKEHITTTEGFFLIFPYYEQSLFEYIVAPGFIHQQVIATILYQLLSALEYLHQGRTKNGHHIMHRDLKPENILIHSLPPKSSSLAEMSDQKYDKNSVQVVLCDFDLSTTFQPGETFNVPCGSLCYVAPEILKKKYNEKCDIWSLGMIMYAMVCGELPRTESEIVVDHNIWDHYQIKYTSIWDHYDVGALALHKKMLCIDPEKRPDATELLSDRWLNNYKLF